MNERILVHGDLYATIEPVGGFTFIRLQDKDGELLLSENQIVVLHQLLGRMIPLHNIIQF